MQDLNDEPLDICDIADRMVAVLEANTERSGRLNIQDICWTEEGIDQSEADEGLSFLIRCGYILYKQVPPPNIRREDRGYGTEEYDGLTDDQGYGTGV